MLKNWLARTLYIHKNSLSKMPFEQLIRWSLGMLKQFLTKIPTAENIIHINMK
jgi:hypothetical protein